MSIKDNVGKALRKRKIYEYDITVEHLKDLSFYAEKAKCSLSYLVTGGKMDCKEEPTPTKAIVASIRHKGIYYKDFFAEQGLSNWAYVIGRLEKGEVRITTLMKWAKKLNLTLAELLSDSECEPVQITRKTYDAPSERQYLRQLALMGWI